MTKLNHSDPELHPATYHAQHWLDKHIKTYAEYHANIRSLTLTIHNISVEEANSLYKTIIATQTQNGQQEIPGA